MMKKCSIFYSPKKKFKSSSVAATLTLLADLQGATSPGVRVRVRVRVRVSLFGRYADSRPPSLGLNGY